MRLTALLFTASLVLAAGVANATDTPTKTGGHMAAKHHACHCKKGSKRCNHKGCDHGTPAAVAPAAEPTYTSPTAWPIPDADPHHPLAPAGAL